MADNFPTLEEKDESILLRYADGTAGPLRVRKIAAWNRGELAMVMSASSGPKDYVRNQICALFDAKPEVNRVVMVRGGGPPFVIVRTDAGTWHDAAGKQVVTGASGQ